MSKKIADVFEKFRGSSYACSKSYKTQRGYGTAARSIVTYMKRNKTDWLADNHPRKCVRDDVRRMVMRWRQDGLANGTIAKYIAFANLAVRMVWQDFDWDVPNPFDGIARNLPIAARERTLTEEEIRSISIALQQPYRDMMHFMLHTALRLGECRNLDPLQVDGDLIWFHGEQSKSRRGEATPLSAAAQEILGRQPPSPVRVFHKNGREITEKMWVTNWRRACKQAGVQDARAHDLRRTCLTNLANNGVPREVTANIARHKNVRTTEKHYLKEKHKVAQKYLNECGRGIV